MARRRSRPRNAASGSAADSGGGRTPSPTSIVVSLSTTRPSLSFAPTVLCARSGRAPSKPCCPATRSCSRGTPTARPTSCRIRSPSGTRSSPRVSASRRRSTSCGTTRRPSSSPRALMSGRWRGGSGTRVEARRHSGFTRRGSRSLTSVLPRRCSLGCRPGRRRHRALVRHSSGASVRRRGARSGRGDRGWRPADWRAVAVVGVTRREASRVGVDCPASDEVAGELGVRPGRDRTRSQNPAVIASRDQRYALSRALWKPRQDACR
jgi:hypothetical protein